MNSRLTRRTLLTAAIGAALTRVAAWAQGTRPRIGIDSYTLRDFQWDAIQLLDYSAKAGIETIQFSELLHLARPLEKATNEAYLKQVRAHAERLNILIEAGTQGVCPTSRAFNPKLGTPQHQLSLAIRAASILGAKSVRCVVGNEVERRENGPIEKHIDAMIQVCRSVRDQAMRAGIKIAIETHKELRAEEMKYLVEQAGPDYVAVCLDTGNPILVIEDPLQTVEILAPYTVTSHIRDTVLWKHPRGAAFQWVALGDGSIGIDNVLREFVKRCPGVSVNLEIITGRPPIVLNYMEPEFWTAFDKVKAQDFTRFLRLVERGLPLMAGMMVPANDPENPAYREAVKQQQRVDLERSLKYARSLNL
jgi:sugar phosphate isomerase/epimerase